MFAVQWFTVFIPCLLQLHMFKYTVTVGKGRQVYIPNHISNLQTRLLTVVSCNALGGVGVVVLYRAPVGYTIMYVLSSNPCFLVN